MAAATNVNLLLVGSMGHIGGAVLDELVNTYSELSITALVRSAKDAATLGEQYRQAKVRTVIGGLEDATFMEHLASNASIVLNCGPDIFYGPAIQSLLRGQASRGTPAFYVGTSGAAKIWDAPTGEVEGRIWDDVADIDEIRAMPEPATHVITDRIISEANTPLLHTAIVAPCFVSGVSASATHPTPLAFPDWLHVVKALDSGATVSKGINRLSFVDVKELGKLYSALVGDALGRLADGENHDAEGLEVWGPKAYYFTASMEASVREFMGGHLIPALQKHGAPYPRSDHVQEVSLEKIEGLIMGRLGGIDNAELWSKEIARAFGINMRTRATRAEKALGFSWMSRDAGIEEAVKVFIDR